MKNLAMIGAHKRVNSYTTSNKTELSGGKQDVHQLPLSFVAYPNPRY